MTKVLKNPLIIFGAGGHAVSVANVAISLGYKIYSFIDSRKQGSKLLGLDVIGSVSDLDSLRGFDFSIAIGDNCVRENIYNQLYTESSTLSFPALVHPSAVVSNFSALGEGVVVMPNAVIGPNSKVGKFCIINTKASIDHDNEVLDFASLGPAATTGGSVIVGFRTAISIGATIKHGVKVGHDSVLGACSYLNNDLPSNCVSYGIPAKIIRSRNFGDSYLN